MHPPPPLSTGKRKRTDERPSNSPTSIQIVTGSYEKALYGVVAHAALTDVHKSAQRDSTSFSPNFLFNAHASSIRCLAVSPSPDTNNSRLLATGGSDEKINVYQLSASAPPPAKAGVLDVAPNANRELGALLHHSSTVTSLSFPSHGKLISASLDNTIAISRIRDWTVLSSIKVPVPKAIGRPSGDTAAPGEVPAGVNDVAVHPSGKLAISVGQGEKCMRLWNLITGKRAGVLTFERKTLAALGETRWRGGEGRSLVWSPDGEQFAVVFERGALVYGIDCTIRGMVRIGESKVCRARYVPDKAEKSMDASILALSTEDGRLLFYNSPHEASSPPGSTNGNTSNQTASTPILQLIAQLGEQKRGNRIKDFVILPDPATQMLHVITGSSEGSIKLWMTSRADLEDNSNGEAGIKRTKANSGINGASQLDIDNGAVVRLVGTLMGTHETNKRITCLGAFTMDAAPINGAKEANGDRDEGLPLNGGASPTSDSEDDFEGFDEEDTPIAAS